MSSHSYQLAQSLEEAFNLIGESMMKAEFAAKLLAYVYVCGGGNEAVVMHEGLNAGIGMAAQKFHIKGGEVPDMEGVRLIQLYTKELEAAEKNKDFQTNPVVYVPWLKEIFDRYKLHYKEGFSTAKKDK